MPLRARPAVLRPLLPTMGRTTPAPLVPFKTTRSPNGPPRSNAAAAAAQQLEHDRAATRDAALARALEAEQEAEAAAQERDNAAKHASDALARAPLLPPWL